MFLTSTWLLRGLILVGGMGAVARALEAEPVSAAVPDAVITSIQQYWDLTSEQKAQPQRFRLECYITYFDPAWKALFIQDMKGVGAYVPYGDNAYPFHPGQRILAAGEFVPPNADISFEHATITDEGPGWPTPLLVGRRIGDAPKFVTKFVTVEGYVDHYRRLEPRELELTLSIDGRSVIAWTQQDLTKPIPNLTDAYVRLDGVYNPKIGPDGQLESIEIMVPDLAHMQVLHHLDDDVRFKLPVEPIWNLPKIPPDRLVRIAGEVKAQEVGRFVRIRDRTGQIDVMTGQTRPCAINEKIEAVGYPSIEGTDWKLTNGLFRPTGIGTPSPNPADARNAQEPLRVAAQVLELSPEEAKAALPVWITGVVTWSNPDSPFFFVQDSSGGVCIMRGKSSSALRAPGRNLEIRGVTAMGQFSPVVIASKFDKVSESVLPHANQISLEHALTGAEEAQWVEMRGYLRQIRARDGWNNLEVATSAGDFTAVLPASEDVSALVGAVIRLHGVCTATANAQRKLTGIKLLVPSSAYVQVEEPAPKDRFDVPLRSLASLGQFGSMQSFSQRLRVAGVVLYHIPGHVIYLQDGDDNLLVFSRETERLRPGDRIEAVGFLGRQGGRVALREAVYRKTGTGAEPAPRAITVQNEPLVADDGRLVSIQGRLLDTSVAGDRMLLTLQTENVIFEAFLETTGTDISRIKMENSSELSLTGVYEVKYDEYGQPSAFQLYLRSAGDVKVLQSPSWLTRRRIMALAGALTLGTLVFIAWVTALRRRVQDQTEQIREQLHRESWLKEELQRAGKIESLGLLAGGIAHDFNNLLTVMMGNIALTRLDSQLTPDSVKSLRSAELAALRARDLTQQLLTFAKGGAPIRAAVLLPEVVREVAEFALRGSNTRCEFDMPAELWPASVDKGQIGQVVQNIVINATQAMPGGGLIEVSLRNEQVGAELNQVLAPGRYVRLSISDRGPGIKAEDLPHIFDPYFTTKKQGHGLGLATVYSIIKKHLGHISAESIPGKSTTFNIWLPAAEDSPVTDVPLVHAKPAEAVGHRPTILFMDDEETIRNLGETLLKRMGYAVTTTCDGVETVREYERAWREGHPFGLVILDLTIPGGMGGRETMEALLKFDPGVRAIVSSGYSNDLVLSDYQAHGFRGMVSKPYEIADFSHAIEQVLKGDRA
ncbi:MAG TPA: ATP-binding protein [Lacunisphaera sp.]